MSRHLAAVMRTAHEHVGGQLSLRNKKGETENVRESERERESYVVKNTAVVQQRVVKYVQLQPLKSLSWKVTVRPSAQHQPPTLINRTLEGLQIIIFYLKACSL